MPFDKLFVKIKCTMCHGTRVFQHSGHHEPRFPYKWKSCPYCDESGHLLIEASHTAIIEYFAQLGAPDRKKLLSIIAARRED
jgi:hypothetical protein